MALVDYFAVTFILYIMAIVEVVAVVWIYGSFRSVANQAGSILWFCRFGKCLLGFKVHVEVESWGLLEDVLGCRDASFAACHFNVLSCENGTDKVWRS